MTPVSHNGYDLVVMKNDDNKKKNVRVHRAIALTWLPNPDNKTQVNHKDLNKRNNKVSNLEWCSPKENMNHFWEQPNQQLNRRPLLFTRGEEKLKFRSIFQASQHFDVALSTIWSAMFTGKWRGYTIEKIEQSVDKQPLLQSIETEGGFTLHCKRV